MARTPFFGQLEPGAEDSSVAGSLIKDLEGDSLGPELGNLILPLGGKAHQVLTYEGGAARWTTAPAPDFQAAIDKLAPLTEVYEGNVVVAAARKTSTKSFRTTFPTAES